MELLLPMKYYVIMKLFQQFPCRKTSLVELLFFQLDDNANWLYELIVFIRVMPGSSIDRVLSC